MECPGPATVVFDQSLTEYDFGITHPMSPVRVDLTMRLADAFGLTREHLPLVPAPVATDDEIAENPRAASVRLRAAERVREVRAA